MHLWCKPYAQGCYLKSCLHCIFLVQRLNCGTAELQDKEYSVCGSRTAELVVQTICTSLGCYLKFCLHCIFLVQRLNCGTAELQDKEYSVCGSRTAELKVTAYSLCGSGTVELLVPYAMARMIRERRGRRPMGQSHLGGAVIYCSTLGFLCVLLSSSNKSADV